MRELRHAAQQALDALTLIDEAMPFPVAKHAITALREALAKPADSGCKFPMCHNKDYQEAVAAQVMAELYTGIVAPPGYALVPVEPTPEMLKAADDYHGSEHYRSEPPYSDEVTNAALYRAMLAAAPQPKDKP